MPGAPGWGTMALAALDAAGRRAARPGPPARSWRRSSPIRREPKPAGEEAVSTPGETVNAALGVPFTLQPGESRTVTFAITWHFPNVQRFQHAGNLYSRRWPDAPAVARYVAAERRGRSGSGRGSTTRRVYQSNLPEEFLDAMTSQSVILRGPTCFWSEDGYFGGFEGSYGCCPLNCTHVWNYAQSHARLFPEVGRNMRISNFITFLHPRRRDVAPRARAAQRLHRRPLRVHRGGLPRIPAQPRPAVSWRQIWPGVKKAVDWLIEAIDKDRDGMPAGHQWNTYDTAVSGRQHVHRLAVPGRAGRRRADGRGDERCGQRRPLAGGPRGGHEEPEREALERRVLHPDSRAAAGPRLQHRLPRRPAARPVVGPHARPGLPLSRPSGCAGPLEAVMKHNFREKFAGFKQVPRRYVPDDEGGLLICTWPHGGRPKPFILYADEVWTGIEYAAAGAMIYEGLIDQARRIVRMARSRYDGRRRDGPELRPRRQSRTTSWSAASSTPGR